MQNTTDPEVTRAQARKLSASAGQRQEPYRGYAHQLHDGRQVYCAPNGKFYVRQAPYVALPLS